jgi:predicted outer membrane repeat protein
MDGAGVSVLRAVSRKWIVRRAVKRLPNLARPSTKLEQIMWNLWRDIEHTLSVISCHRVHRCSGAVLFTLAFGLSGFTGATTIYNVDSPADTIDDNTGDSLCHTAAGKCTLRAAIMQANVIADDVTINVPAGTYFLSLGALNIAAPVSGVPLITISGAGRSATIIDGDAIDRVIAVAAGRNAKIIGVTLQHGKLTTGDGAGISNSGTLAISDSTIDSNNAADTGTTGSGGGIYTPNSADLTLDNVVVSNNVAAHSGGGLYLNGIAHLTGCTFFGNQTSGAGGAIYNSGGSVTVTRSALSVNSAGPYGGGVFLLSAQLTLDHAVVYGNSAGTGGGVSAQFSTITANSSTIADNTGFLAGGIYLDGSSAYIDDSTVSANTGNTTGGLDVHTSLAALYLTNSTVSGNTSTSTSAGGGITNHGAANVYNSTIAFNRALTGYTSGSAQGGGVLNIGTFNARNTIIARNSRNTSPVDDDCSGTIGMYGNDRLGTLAGCTAAVAGTGSATLLDSAGELGPLGDHGGPTATHSLVPPSNMINGGDTCIDRNGMVLERDQRGYARPIGAACDVGAFEYDPEDIFASNFEY